MRALTEPRAQRMAFFLTLLAACAVFYGRYLVGYLPVGEDHSLLHAPYFSHRWDGGPPLWDRGCASGSPLYDNLQCALLYPLRWPFFFLGEGQWTFYYGPYFFVHCLLAFAGMGVFLRQMELGWIASVAGAVVFAAGGHVAGRMLNPGIFCACCWLPWLLAGAVGAVARRPAWLTAGAMAMILMVGNPYLIVYSLAAYAIVFSFLGWRTGEGERPLASFVRGALRRGRCLALAFLLAAPVLAPGLLRSARSIRTFASPEWNLTGSVHWSEIVPMMLGGSVKSAEPMAYPEYIDKALYIGPVTALGILWLAFLPASWRDRRFLCAVALSLAGLGVALGRNLGWGAFTPLTPLFRVLAGPPRALALTAVGLGLLAGLAMENWLRKPPRAAGAGLVLAALGLANFAPLAFKSPETLEGQGASFFLGQWLKIWAVVPGCLSRGEFHWVDGGVGLLAAALVVASVARWPLPRAVALASIVFAQLWHFFPRVAAPVEPRQFYAPLPPVAFLQAQAKSSAEPFRIVGYDPLRIHDAQFINVQKIDLLMPNLATLYGLEDIQGFDPLIDVRYQRLIERTSGRAPYNDPFRHLDIDHPDPKLFDLLGVRFMIGHPHDRRLANLPQTLDAQTPAQPAIGWDSDRATTAPIVQWLFVSLAQLERVVPLGAEIARLRVEAEEGVFNFPVRNGIETASIEGAGGPRSPGDAAFHATLNDQWTIEGLSLGPPYRGRLSNYRGRIDFGRPLHVKQAQWELVENDLTFHVVCQAFRLAPPARSEDDPWRLAFGREDDDAPVFEYTRATARACLIPRYQKDSDGAATVDEDLLRGPASGVGSGRNVQWLERRTNSMRLLVQADRPSLLVLREIGLPGWKARINGNPARILQVNGLWPGIEIQPGRSEVSLVCLPSLPLAILAGVVVALAACLGWATWRRSRSE